MCGNLLGLLTTLKSLPLAYNKDMQEDKEPVFDSLDTVKGSLAIGIEMIRSLTVRPDRARQALKAGYLTATDLADYLVSKGIDALRLTAKGYGSSVSIADDGTRECIHRRD